MIKLKKIYYPILAAVFAVALVLGFIASYVNLGAKSDQTFVDDVRVHAEVMESVHNSYEPGNQTAVRDYIENQLFSNGILRSAKPQDFNTAVIEGPSYVFQEVTLSEETFSDMYDDQTFYAVKDLTNIIVAIPGKSEDAVLFTANYDSAAKSQSGTESIQAAAMLQTVINVVADYEKGKTPEKTLLFVFTDAEHEGALGAYAFKNQFEGFDGIVDKIKLAVNFGASGTGALAISTDSVAISEVRGLASDLNDALNSAYQGVSDYDVFDVAKINVFFSGDDSYLNTSRDTIANVSDAKIKAMGGAISALVSAYGFGEIKEIENAGTFSYMGLAFSYSPIVAYVLGGVAIALLALAIFMMVRGNKISGLIKGTVAQLVAVVAAAIILLACYFLLALILAGFGAIPIHALVTVRYMNVGLFIASLVLAFAAYTGMFLVLRRFYKVKATDAARGGAVILTILGAVMAFAMPSGAFIFALTAVLESAILNATICLAGKFKAKYGADIERVFAYTLPLVLLTPAMIPMLMTTCYSVSAVYLPVILTVAVLGLTVIAPYFALLKPALERAVAKLPKHTVRVEKVVTEQVEGAKKGRFQEVTRKKVVKEKVEWTYHNRYGLALLGILAALIIILSAVIPTKHFDSNVVNSFSYREALKDNAIVFVWEQDGNQAQTEMLKIYDQTAHSYFATVDNEYAWNPDEQAFEKLFTGNSSELHGTLVPLNIEYKSDENGVLEFKTYDNASNSFIDITFTNVSRVSKITLVANGEDDIEIENDGKDTIHIAFPYDENNYGTFTVKFEYEQAVEVGVEFVQYYSGAHAEMKMNSVIDYSEMLRAFEEADFKDEISCGMIFIRKNAFKMS